MDLQEAVRRSSSDKFNYPDIFDIDCGIGDYIDLGVSAIPSWGRGTLHKQRCAILEIRTWKGISWNAIHFYGKLVIDGVYVSDINNHECSKNITGEQEKQYPLLNYIYEFKIKRPLTKKEIEADPKRWGDYYCDGDLIDGYEEMTDLIEDTKEIMKLRFKGNWHFYYQTPRGIKTKIEL